MSQLIFRLVILIFSCLISVRLNAESHNTSTPLRLGLTVDLSGTLAAVGNELRQVAQIAADEINARRGAGTVEIVLEDNRFDPRSAVAAAKLFTSIHKVDGVVTFGSTTSLAAVPIFEEAHIPTIAIAMSDRVTAGREFVVQMFLPLQKQARLMLEETSRRGYKSIGIVCTIQESMLDVRNAYIAAKNHSTVVDSFEVQINDTNFKTIATRLAAQKPDAILMMVIGSQIGSLSRQLREVGYTGELFGAMQLGDPAAIKASGQALQGAWHSAVNLDPVIGLSEKFKTRYGNYPFSETAFAYDSITLLAEALLQSKRDAKKAAQWLHNVKDWHGAAGIFSSLPEGRFSLIGRIDLVPTPRN